MAGKVLDNSNKQILGSNFRLLWIQTSSNCKITGEINYISGMNSTIDWEVL